MVRKTIEVTISPDGEVTVEANGYTGPECEHATWKIEEALGIVRSRKAKPERFESKQSQKQEASSW